MMNEYKHGDKIALLINNDTYLGHIEERMTNQWPNERFDTFVIVNSAEIDESKIQK